MDPWITTKLASELLGLSRGRIKGLCGEGKLRAKKPSRDWLIDSSSAEFIWRQMRYQAKRKARKTKTLV